MASTDTNPNAHLGFLELVKTMVFFVLLWFSSRSFEYVHLPGLIGEVLLGSIFGPLLINLVPESHALIMLGEIGLVLLVVEAGLEIDLSVMKQIGLRGLLVGALGSVLPLCIGIGIGSAFGLEFKSAFALGCCVAPTSMGVALVVLKAGNVLDTPTGQVDTLVRALLIVAAAVVDDVVALVILSELKAMTSSSPVAFAIPVLSAVGFSVVVGGLALNVVPNLVNKYIVSSINRPEKILLLLMTVLSIGLMCALHFGRSSHLLGAFLGGLCFCAVPSTHDTWNKHVKTILKAMLRIFFACTIGFQIPIKSFWSPSVIKLTLAILVCLSGKLALGLFATPLTASNFLTVGVAMSTWGEFAFIIAVTAKNELILDEDTYSSIVFAVLLSMIISPALLRRTLDSARSRNKQRMDAIIETEKGHATRVYYKLAMRMENLWGLQTSLLSLFASLGLEMIDFHSHLEEGLVFYESYLKDLRLQDHAPETREAVGLNERIAAITNEIDELFSSKREQQAEHMLPSLTRQPTSEAPRHCVQLARWLPGETSEELVEYGLDEAKALKRMSEQGFSPGKVVRYPEEEPLVVKVDIKEVGRQGDSRM